MMEIFWILVVLIMVLSAWLIYRASTAKMSQTGTDSTQLRVTVFRENIEELESELQTGDLDTSQLENVRSELELSLLAEVKSEQERSQLVHEHYVNSTQKPLLIVTTALVCLAVLLYVYLGNPQVIKMSGLAGSEVYSENPGEYQPSAQMVVLMEQHLKKNPEDVNGLYFLASNYIAMSDYINAADSLEKLYQITGDNPQVLLSYVDVLVRLNNGSFAGRATELVERAVLVAPDNYSALLFAGLAAEETGNYQKANGYYKRLVPVLEGQPELLNTINTLIANTEKMFQESRADIVDLLPDQASDQQVSISLSVSIDDELEDAFSEDDVLFVYAQAIGGSPMPLAVYRTEAGALPLEVTLDDTLAMMPTHKISDFDEVKIQARISKSGTAEVSSGDLIGVIENVQVLETQALNLQINTIVP